MAEQACKDPAKILGGVLLWKVEEKKGKLLIISFPYRPFHLFSFILSSLAIKHTYFLLISLATDFLCVHLVTPKKYIFLCTLKCVFGAHRGSSSVKFYSDDTDRNQLACPSPSIYKLFIAIFPSTCTSTEYTE